MSQRFQMFPRMELCKQPQPDPGWECLAGLRELGMRSEEQGLGAHQVHLQCWRSRADSSVFPLRIGGRAFLGGSPVPWGAKQWMGFGLVLF